LTTCSFRLPEEGSSNNACKMRRNSLIQLILIHYREFIREPGILFWSIIFPVLMAWVLGIAFSKQAGLAQQVAFIDDSSNMNPELRQFLHDAKNVDNSEKNGEVYLEKTIQNEKLGKTTFKFLMTDWDGGLLLLKRGQVNLILREYPDSVEYFFDPLNPQAKMVYILLSSAINNENLVYESASINPLTQKGNRYIDFLIPGLVAMGVMNSLLWGISYALIEMRSKKLLRRMVATPMKRSEFLISIFVARLSITIIEALLLLSFAFVYFHISIQGSLPALILIFLAGNIAFSGIAILISSRTANSRIGTGLINVITMPMTVLSGIFFSYHNFPDFAVPIIQKFPLTMMADSIRSVFIEGAGIAQVSLNALILSALGLICFAIGLRTYKWY
jgi:ABC-2 type transport system permease protein